MKDGRRLRKLRKARGLTLAEVAAEHPTVTTPSGIWYLENQPALYDELHALLASAIHFAGEARALRARGETEEVPDVDK